MAWELREGNDLKPAMTEEQILLFKEQYPIEFNKTYKEV